MLSGLGRFPITVTFLDEQFHGKRSPHRFQVLVIKKLFIAHYLIDDRQFAVLINFPESNRIHGGNKYLITSRA